MAAPTAPGASSSSTPPATRRFFPDYSLGLLWNLALRELRSKYKRSLLGWGWSLLNPLAQLGIYSVVFGLLFQTVPPVGDPSGIGFYGFYLVAGLLPWAFFTNNIMGSIQSLTSNGNLIRKVYFPRSILPFATSLSWMVSFAIELLALTVVLLVFQTMNLLLLPVVVVAALVLMVFGLGLGLAVSAFNVYFRDVEYLTGILLQIWFFLTPIVYTPAQMVNPDTGQPYVVLGVSVLTLQKANPMYHFVGLFRTLFYDQRLPGLSEWGWVLGFAAGALLVGSLVFRKVEPRMAEEL